MNLVVRAFGIMASYSYPFWSFKVIDQVSYKISFSATFNLFRMFLSNFDTDCLAKVSEHSNKISMTQSQSSSSKQFQMNCLIISVSFSIIKSRASTISLILQLWKHLHNISNVTFLPMYTQFSLANFRASLLEWLLFYI